MGSGTALRGLGFSATVMLLAGAAAFALPPGYILTEDIDDWEVRPFCGSPLVRFFLQGAKLEGGASGIVVFDSQGTAYVACGSFIQVVTPAGSARILTGAPGVTGSTDGPPWKTTFGDAYDIAIADDETLYVVDRVNFTLRRIRKRADGVWHTSTVAGVPGKKGHRDGPAKQALFTVPFDGIAMGEDGAVYLLDGNWLRKLENGVVTTLNAGTGRRDGPLREAKFDRIMGGRHTLTADGRGNLYVADRWSMSIRKVDLKAKTVTTIAGVRPGEQKGRPKDGPALAARFHPGGGPVVVFYNRKHDFLLVRSADEGGRIRKIAGGFVKTFGPAPGGGQRPLVGPWRGAAGGSPAGVDAKGNVYIGGSQCIRVIEKKGDGK